MADIDVRDATIDDINDFADNMRPEDIEECQSVHKLDNKQGLQQSFNLSQDCKVGILDGKVFCIFGCVPGEEETIIWMLFSKNVTYLPISFFRKSKEHLQQILEKYGRVGNYVLPQNTFILKWIKWLGFTVKENETVGDISIHRFWIDRRDYDVSSSVSSNRDRIKRCRANTTRKSAIGSV